MDMVSEARSRIAEVDAQGMSAVMQNGGAVIVDVREPDEFSQGRVEGAVNIPRGVAEMGVPRLAPDPATRIIFYCAGGMRSALVADNLRQMGYENVASLAGGFQSWARSGGKIVR
jgi:rhodanese-related sulfurtransferase